MATAAACAAAADAPFLWLRLGGWALSDARDDRDRGSATAASVKVANAGVDGLLARPLFVVNGVAAGATTVGGVGGGTTVFGSFFASASFAPGLDMPSFFPPFGTVEVDASI